MNAETKKAADREYVDRFFHGVASKLMTHPYFSKFANQANMSAEVPASVASLESVLAKVAAAKKAAAEAEAKKRVVEGVVNSVARTPVSLEQYKKNVAHVRTLFQDRSKLLQELKAHPKDSQDSKYVSTAIQEIDGRIMAVYASGKQPDVYISKVGAKSPPSKAVVERVPQVPSQPAPSSQALSQSIPDFHPLRSGLDSIPQRKPQQLQQSYNANVTDALQRIAEVYNQKANQLQIELVKYPRPSNAVQLERQILALRQDAKSVVQETPLQKDIIEKFKDYNIDEDDRPKLTDEQIAAILARTNKASPFSARLGSQNTTQPVQQVDQPEADPERSDVSFDKWKGNGGRIQRKRTVNKRKNKRPQ